MSSVWLSLFFVVYCRCLHATTVMMNYGFCLADNSCEYRIVSLRTPPGSPLYEAKMQQAQMYPHLATGRDADEHYYVFNIFYPLLAPESTMENTIFSPALFNAVSVLAANVRELETLAISEQAIQIPGQVYGNSRNVLAALSQIIIELITHIVKLRASAQDGLPRNLKQSNAKTYRDSQIMLSEIALIIAAWTLVRARQHGDSSDEWSQIKEPLNAHMSRIPPGKFPKEVTSRIKVRVLERKSLLRHGGELFTFDELFGQLPDALQEPCKTCLRRILVHAERAIPVLNGMADASPFAFPLFLCLVTATSSPEEKPHRLDRWIRFILDKYPPPPDDVTWMLEDEDDESLAASFDALLSSSPNLLAGAPGFTPSPNWIRWAWMVVEQESVHVPDDPMRLLATDGLGQGAVMLSTVSYLYIPQAVE